MNTAKKKLISSFCITHGKSSYCLKLRLVFGMMNVGASDYSTAHLSGHSGRLHSGQTQYSSPLVHIPPRLAMNYKVSGSQICKAHLHPSAKKRQTQTQPETGGLFSLIREIAEGMAGP